MLDLFFNNPNLVVVALGGGAWWLCYIRYKVTKSRTLLNCIPGIFTSLGLLGTFFSICFSLHNIGDVDPALIDNTGKTLAQVRAEGNQGIDIIRIISELIPAFTSSIAGLIGALLSTFWAKYFIFSLYLCHVYR